MKLVFDDADVSIVWLCCDSFRYIRVATILQIDCENKNECQSLNSTVVWGGEAKKRWTLFSESPSLRRTRQTQCLCFL